VIVDCNWTIIISPKITPEAKAQSSLPWNSHGDRRWRQAGLLVASPAHPGDYSLGNPRGRQANFGACWPVAARSDQLLPAMSK